MTSGAAADSLSSDPTISLSGNPWLVKTGNGPMNDKSAAWVLPSNVTTVNGDVVISTMRHCGAIGTPNAPAHPKPCDRWKDTWYSTGRIELDKTVLAHNFTYTVNAKLEGGGKASPGTRQAIWMRNQQGYCGHPNTPKKTLLGEFDLAEFYGTKSRPETVTHLTCKEKKTLSDSKSAPAFNTKEFKKFSVSVQQRKVSYRIGDQAPHATSTCGKKAFSPEAIKGNGYAGWKEACNTALSGPWLLVINGDVFKPNKGLAEKFQGPAWKENFPTQKMIIRSATFS